MSESPSVQVQRCLDKLNAGDLSARDELIGVAMKRLEHLARKMFGDYRSLRRWEETGDVLQGAAIRLHRSLAEVTPATSVDFFRFAALQIRRQLLDSCRHYFGNEGIGVNHASVSPQSDASTPAFEAGEQTHDPARLAEWREFHEQVESLPEDERQVFDLLYYQELTQDEAAQLLGVSVRTIKYRWQAVRMRLAETLKGGMPGI